MILLQVQKAQRKVKFFSYALSQMELRVFFNEWSVYQKLVGTWQQKM